MAKKVIGQIKLHLPGGQATPAPPVGPALGQHGLNIMDFCKAFNARTQKDQGIIIPVVITVFADRTYTFITKTPPASFLLRRACGLDKGSGEPNRIKVGYCDDVTGGGDRQDQNAGSQRRVARCRCPDHPRHGAVDGR